MSLSVLLSTNVWRFMVSGNTAPSLSQDLWNCRVTELSDELVAFVQEFGSFTPDWFAEVKFHLLRDSALDLTTRDEFCQTAIYTKQCGSCDQLYMSRNCLLWYQLFDRIRWKTIARAPPCIKAAYRKKSIKLVANYMTRANLVSPPFYKPRAAPLCKNMQNWGHCEPDQYCKLLRSGKLLDYNAVREHAKMIG